MANSRQHLGRKGEELAAVYLKKRKYKILCRNYSCRLGEIDIVAQDSDDLVFVEVKTRSSDIFGPPAAAVTIRKQHQIIKVAQLYLQEHKLEESPIRFDVVSVIIDKMNRKQIEIITNAFEYCG